MHSFSSLYNENTVISEEYTVPFDFDITGVACIFHFDKDQKEGYKKATECKYRNIRKVSSY